MISWYITGISQDVKEENILTSMSFQPSRQSVMGPPTPPGQRKSGRPLAAITAPLTQRGNLHDEKRK